MITVYEYYAHDKDYEGAVLAKQGTIRDDCSDCPYAGVDTCKSQCMDEDVYVFDSDLFKYVKVSSQERSGA